MLSEEGKGLFFVVLGTFFWSTIGVSGKFAVARLDPLSIIVVRLIIAFLILSLILFLKRLSIRLTRWDYPLLIVFGLFGVALFHASFFLSLERIPASITAVLLYVSPFLVLLASLLFFQETLTWKKGVGFFFTFLGCVLVLGIFQISDIQLDRLGILFGFFSAFGYTCFTLFSKYFLRRFHPLVVIWYGFGIGLFFLSFLRPPTLIWERSISLEVLFLILYIAVFPTLLAYSLYLKGLQRMEASRAILITTLEPVFTVIMAYFLLKERLAIPQLIGATLILVAILFIRLDKVKKMGGTVYATPGQKVP